MLFKNEVIDNSTDLDNILKLNLLSEPIVDIYFTFLLYLKFDYYINLSVSVDRHSSIAIFDLFFTLEQIYIFVKNINKNRPFY
jgi:hypothetical protein